MRVSVGKSKEYVCQVAYKATLSANTGLTAAASQNMIWRVECSKNIPKRGERRTVDGNVARSGNRLRIAFCEAALFRQKESDKIYNRKGQRNEFVCGVCKEAA